MDKKIKGKSQGDTHILIEKELEAQRMNTNEEKDMGF